MSTDGFCLHVNAMAYDGFNNMSDQSEHERSEKLKRLCAQYFRRRCQSLPVSPRSKRPLKPNWQHQQLTYEQIVVIIEAHPDINLGVLLGHVSAQLVDIDIDEPKAIGIFNRLMSPTASMFGRRSKPGSHRIYRVRLEDLCVGVKFPHPVTGRMIAELRANGEMTVFPGSTHESGEEIEFVGGFDGEPAVVSYLILRRECGFACTGFLLGEHWVEGSRHNKTLAFSGLCASNNIPASALSGVDGASIDYPAAHGSSGGQSYGGPTVSAANAFREPSGFGRPTVLSLAVCRSISELSSAPRSTMTTDSHIQVMKPMPAPRDP